MNAAKDCSPPGSSVHGIFQARILEWLPFPTPEDLSDPEIKPMSPALTGGFFISEPPGMPTATFLIRSVMLKTAGKSHQAFVRTRGSTEAGAL